MVCETPPLHDDHLFGARMNYTPCQHINVHAHTQLDWCQHQLQAMSTHTRTYACSKTTHTRALSTSKLSQFQSEAYIAHNQVPHTHTLKQWAYINPTL